MRLFHRIRRRFYSLLRRGKAEAELSAEFRCHVERQIAENVATGMTGKRALSVLERLDPTVRP